MSPSLNRAGRSSCGRASEVGGLWNAWVVIPGCFYSNVVTITTSTGLGGGSVHPDVNMRAPRSASIAGSAQNTYMRRVYGERFEYQDFAPLFSCSDFDPAAWAALFKQSGAQGAMATTSFRGYFGLSTLPSTNAACYTLRSAHAGWC